MEEANRHPQMEREVLMGALELLKKCATFIIYSENGTVPGARSTAGISEIGEGPPDLHKPGLWGLEIRNEET